MNTNWVERIKARMDELDMTQEILANRLNITRGAVTHYLTGRSVPPLRQFHKLAQILQVDPAWLQFGIKSSEKVDDEKAVANQHRLPLLTAHEVAGFISFTKEHRKQIKHWLRNFFTDHEHWYALQIKNDAMIDKSGSRRGFYEGDYIIVDPGKTANHGDYVLALLPRASEVIFRQLVVDGGVQYLKPLNVQYPIMSVEKNTVICGAVVGTFAGISI